MIEARKAVVWTHEPTKTVLVAPKGKEFGPQPRDGWSDPIGASYRDWQRDMDDGQRERMLEETATDLATRGYDLGAVLKEFAKVDCFRK